MKQIKCDKCGKFIGSIENNSHFMIDKPGAKLSKFCGNCKPKEKPKSDMVSNIMPDFFV